MASTITVKSDLQGDKRRFQLDVRGGFDALRLAVETAYGECNLLIKYEDDEKDLVTLVSDDDLQEAIRVLNSMNLASPLRLSVFNSAVAVKAETAVPPTASCLGMAGPSAPWSQAASMLKQQTWLIKQLRNAGKEERRQSAVPGLCRQDNGDKKQEKVGNPVKQMARFVSHITLTEGENLVSGSTCNKVWRVRNDSQQPWPLGAKLVYVSGKAADRLSPQDSYPVSVALAPGQEADISVEIVAPAAPGKYEAFWRLQGPKGKKFGQRLGCSILVTGKDTVTSLDSAEDDESESDNELSDGFVDVGPKPAKAEKNQWDPQLSLLHEMGFTDEKRCIKFLRKFNGNIDKTAEKLTRKDPVKKKVAKASKLLAQLATKLSPSELAAILPVQESIAQSASPPAPLQHDEAIGEAMRPFADSLVENEDIVYAGNESEV